MKKFISVNCLLWVGVVVSMCILMTRIFPILQIPFSILDIEGTKCFNSIMESLAVSYLSGVFVYYLTVILTYRRNRRRKKWDLNAVFKDYQSLEKLTGERWELFNEDCYKELKEKEITKLFNGYEYILKNLHYYDNVLTEEELDWLHDISRNLDFEVYNPYMQPVEIEKNIGQIKEINNCIVKLQCSFTELIKH